MRREYLRIYGQTICRYVVIRVLCYIYTRIHVSIYIYSTIFKIISFNPYTPWSLHSLSDLDYSFYTFSKTRK